MANWEGLKGINNALNDCLFPPNTKLDGLSIYIRFVRVHARNIGVCPDGHPGAGNKAWLFADEIIVE